MSGGRYHPGAVDFASRIDRLRAQLPELEADAFLATSLAERPLPDGLHRLQRPGPALRPSAARSSPTGGTSARPPHEVPDLERVVYPDGARGGVRRGVPAAGRCRGSRSRTDDVTVSAHDALADAGRRAGPDPRGGRAPPVGEGAGRAQRCSARRRPSPTGRSRRSRGRLREGMTEKELALDIDDDHAAPRGRRGGVRHASWPSARAPPSPITARATAPSRRGDMVKMDFGALMGGYHSDMTRTVAFGEPPGQLREVYEVVRARPAGGHRRGPGRRDRRRGRRGRRAASSGRRGSTTPSTTAWATASGSRSTRARTSAGAAPTCCRRAP